MIKLILGIIIIFSIMLGVTKSQTLLGNCAGGVVTAIYTMGATYGNVYCTILPSTCGTVALNGCVNAFSIGIQ